MIGETSTIDPGRVDLKIVCYHAWLAVVDCCVVAYLPNVTYVDKLKKVTW